jgi:hypothetical protein
MPSMMCRTSENDTIELPIIDISSPTLEVGRQMIDAAAKYGFLYVDTKGTDFTAEMVDREFELVSLSPASEHSSNRI